MSDLIETKKRVQTALRERGLYSGEIDGLDGLLTWNAIAKVVIQTEAVPPPAGETPTQLPPDARSAANIATLLPPVQPLATELLALLRDAGITAKVISGLRSYEEQNRLYAIGRTEPGAIVTNARGGQSNHNFGLAFDLGIFENGRYLDDSPLYRKAGAIGKSIGLLWGGDWSNDDEPHFELRPEWAENLSENDALAAYRQRVNTGTALA